jgi:hypothetical protein
MTGSATEVKYFGPMMGIEHAIPRESPVSPFTGAIFRSSRSLTDFQSPGPIDTKANSKAHFHRNFHVSDERG